MYESPLTRADINSNEATRDCVFILQERVWRICWDAVECGYPDCIFTPEHSSEIYQILASDNVDPDDVPDLDPQNLWENYLPSHIKADLLDEWEKKHWANQEWDFNRAEGAIVWYSREEAEDWARQREHYKWPYGWRVYGVCAHGELARAITYYWEENRQ